MKINLEVCLIYNAQTRDSVQACVQEDDYSDHSSHCHPPAPVPHRTFARLHHTNGVRSLFEAILRVVQVRIDFCAILEEVAKANPTVGIGEPCAPGSVLQ